MAGDTAGAASEGTLLKEVLLELTNEGYYLGRPLGSYPVTVKIPLDDRQAALYFESGTPLTCFVTGAEERSIRALCYPLKISQMGSIAFSQIPGVGKKAASRLFAELGGRKESGEKELQDWLQSQGARLQVALSEESPVLA